MSKGQVKRHLAANAGERPAYCAYTFPTIESEVFILTSIACNRGNSIHACTGLDISTKSFGTDVDSSTEGSRHTGAERFDDV